MNARLMSSTEGLEQRTAPNSSPPAPAETELPLDGERLDLIRRFQREALARPNPLAANLAMINSDLMKLCQRLSKSMEKSVAKLGSSAGEHEQLARQTMTYLAVVRQIDRLAHLDLALSKECSPET
jgi:hypothetical protein